MDTKMMNEKSQEISNSPNMLARLAKREIRQMGYTNVRCPKCGTAPKVKMTSRGERTIVTCECRYVHDVEINF